MGRHKKLVQTDLVIALMIPIKVDAKLMALAHNRNTSKSAIIREAIDFYFKQGADLKWTKNSGN